MMVIFHGDWHLVLCLSRSFLMYVHLDSYLGVDCHELYEWKYSDVKTKQPSKRYSKQE